MLKADAKRIAWFLESAAAMALSEIFYGSAGILPAGSRFNGS